MSKRKGSRIKMLVIILAVLVVLITGGAAAYLHGIGAVDANSDETVTVTVPSGSGASAIIDILDENGLSGTRLLRRYTRDWADTIRYRPTATCSASP